MTTTTLCYIENDNKYLMLHRVKKKNDMNEGKWIGVGGHVESQETPEECLVREVKEETGLTLTSYKFRGLVTFINSESESELMCVFTADGYTGELIECNEGELCWIDKARVIAGLITEKIFYLFHLQTGKLSHHFSRNISNAFITFFVINIFSISKSCLCKTL